MEKSVMDYRSPSITITLRDSDGRFYVFGAREGVWLHSPITLIPGQTRSRFGIVLSLSIQKFLIYFLNEKKEESENVEKLEEKT